MEFVPLRCPICGRPVGRALNESGVSYVEARCRNARCAMKPLITFRLAEGRASPHGLIDRREHQRVS